LVDKKHKGGIFMPTGTKLETALASAKGLAADMKTFSLDTDNQDAKQMFNQLSSTMDNVAQTIQSRLDFVKQEEPQYRQ
jgi:uncharacterized protein YpmS